MSVIAAWYDTTRVRCAAAIATAIALCLLTYSTMTGALIEGDAAGNLKMALNWSHDGVMALDLEAPTLPSMYREPLPVVATGLMIQLADAVHGEVEPLKYYEGYRAKFLKSQNFLWLALLCVGAFLACRFLGLPFYLALAVAVVSHLLFFSYPAMRMVGSDTLLSEIAASGLIVMGAVWLIRSHAPGTGAVAAVLMGVCFGMLTMTKAYGLYLYIGLVGVLLAAMLLRRKYAFVPSLTLSQVIIATLCFAVVVVPWMTRNYLIFDRFSISERGGVAVWSRAIMNDLTPSEYAGSFYVWAPRPLRSAVGTVTGYSPTDLRRGNRLQRLNGDAGEVADFEADDLAAERAGQPDKAISFFRAGRAERVRAQNRFRDAGDVWPRLAADEYLMSAGFDLILSRVPRHLAVTIPLTWRGAIFTFPIFVVGLIYSFATRRYDIALLVLPGIGTVLFYALFTPFEARYGIVLFPLAIVAAVTLIARMASPVPATSTSAMTAASAT